MKNWNIRNLAKEPINHVDDVVGILLENRGIHKSKDQATFLTPPDPLDLTAKDVGIFQSKLTKGIARIEKAIEKHESIVVYADYDADGISAGAILWEALYALGARVMPYVPHRLEEGYGLSEKGIQNCIAEYNPSLIITVDHGITAADEVAYAKTLGIDVIVTDHHLPPTKIPACTVIHTTALCGAGVSWFVAKTLLGKHMRKKAEELLAFAAIGTIADMVPLVGPNRSIAKFGIEALNKTKRIGIRALIREAGLNEKLLETSDVSHVIAPRLNAMGRLEHAIDALRLLCTTNTERATILALKLGMTNKERQQMTVDTTLHALSGLSKNTTAKKKKILIVSDESYNPGIIGLVAGKLTEEYYRPSIVIAIGNGISKASARSVSGFNIVEFIRGASNLLLDVGGHPMAAGFTIETKNIPALVTALEQRIEKALDDALLIRSLAIDAMIPSRLISKSLYVALSKFAPFGLGNYEPVFATNNLTVMEIRKIGAKLNHLKMKIRDEKGTILNAVGFGIGHMSENFPVGSTVDVAYTLNENTWNGITSLQLKIRDMRPSCQ